MDFICYESPYVYSLKVYSPCLQSLLDPYFDELRSHRKVYQNFIFNLEDIWKGKFEFYAFFHTGKAVSSQVFAETSCSDGFCVIKVPVSVV